jgi:HEAT repeat protein
MSKSLPVGQRLAALATCCCEPNSAEAASALRAALADRSNYVVKKAAGIIGEAKLVALAPELVQAFQRLLDEPEKSDPGCLGKTAIVVTLVNLEYEDVAFYRRAIRYVQAEPVWGGEQDSAAQLRAAAAAGLVGCARVLEALLELADLLMDRAKDARAGAARALAQLSAPEGAALLRLKLQMGDPEPEVLGECSTAILKLAGDDGLPYVVGLLVAENPDVCIQAALALGQSRQPAALAPLRDCWERHSDASVKDVLLASIGLMRRPGSTDFLVSLVAKADLGTAGSAIRALTALRSADDVRQAVEAAVVARGEPKLIAEFKAEFSPRK